jgi:hypothetical protein
MFINSIQHQGVFNGLSLLIGHQFIFTKYGDDIDYIMN